MHVNCHPCPLGGLRNPVHKSRTGDAVARREPSLIAAARDGTKATLVQETEQLKGELSMTRWWNIAGDLPDVSNVFAGSHMAATARLLCMGLFSIFCVRA